MGDRGLGRQRLCSFCRQFRAGGVAGPTPDVYICPDCIELVAEILTEQRRGPESEQP